MNQYKMQKLKELAHDNYYHILNLISERNNLENELQEILILSERTELITEILNKLEEEIVNKC